VCNKFGIRAFFLGEASMADGTQMNQMAETLAALKKTVDRNEEIRKQCDAETNKKFETITADFKSIQCDFQNEFKIIQNQLKQLIPVVPLTAGKEKENPVLIEAAPAKDKVAVQNINPVVPQENMGYQLQDCRDARRLPFPDYHVGGTNCQENQNLDFSFKKCPEVLQQPFGNVAWQQRGDSRRQFAGEFRSRLHNFDNVHARMEQNVEDSSDIIPRSVRIDFPRFDGNDPTDWLYRVEQYVEFYNTSYRQLFRLIAIHMEGRALVWYQDICDSSQFHSWEGFTRAVLTRFGPSSYDDPMETLMRLRQYSTMEDYKGKFESISNRLKGISDFNRLSCFLSGLKDEIRIPVKMFNPSTLLEAFSLAKMQEENVLANRRNFRNANPNYSGSNSQRINSSNVVQNNFSSGQNSGSIPKAVVPVQKISPLQMEERRKKGLCYNCDSKWNPGHRCVAPKLFLLEHVEVGENEFFADSPASVPVDPMSDLIEFSDGDIVLEISLHAVT
jgi:hypothetical protein